jgi:hypothetical protein
MLHSTRPHGPGLPNWVPSPRMAKRRRTAAMRGLRLPLQLLQPWLEDGASAISAPGHRETTAARAPCIPTLTTVPQNATRSSSSRNASVSVVSSRLRMAPRLDIGLVRRGLTTMKWPRGNENSGMNCPRGTSRTSSLEILTPRMTATAARNCTSCVAGAGSLPPAGTSSPCVVRSCQ